MSKEETPIKTVNTVNTVNSVNIQSIKGMSDVLPEQIYLWQYLENHLRSLVQSYGYDEIRFPILEKSELFKRSIGEASDIVEKEMFTFNDRDKHNTLVSMRPEGTAGCVRACLEHGLLRNKQQQRLWYMGPMFRRENPQKGRFRQFNQLGVESFGVEDSAIEAEHILMMASLWQKLNISTMVKLEINNIGNLEARNKYKVTLQEYFNKYFNDLDEDSKRRLSKNPLRILDSKDPKMQPIIAAAPIMLDSLDNASDSHFERLKLQLQDLGIEFTINPYIVRGLDYYNSTVYEWTTDRLGAQAAVCAGGRYDSLSNIIGGVETFGVGFALGIERTLLLMQEQGAKAVKKLDCYLIAVGENAARQSLLIAEKIRALLPNISLMVNVGEANFKTQFKRADKSNASVALILGDDELAANKISIKFLREEKEQMTVKFEELTKILGGLS